MNKSMHSRSRGRVAVVAVEVAVAVVLGFMQPRNVSYP